MKKAPVHDKYIPAHGPVPAKILAVGEAGGEDEERLGLPFVGRSGRLYSDHMTRHGVRRDVRDVERTGKIESEVFTTNLSKYRPNRNKFHNLLGTKQLEEGLEELKEEIERVDPSVIHAMGGWPLYFLTGKCGEKNGKPAPGTGIGNYRGSILPSTFVEGRKVVASHHPAYILRNYVWHPVFDIDCQRVVRESASRDIRFPGYEVFVDPPNVWEFVDEFSSAEWISFDIETFAPGEMSCFGACCDDQRALVITFQNPHGGFEPARRICESNARKIAQYGTYDCMFLHHFYGWNVRNYAFDTYIAAASLMGQFPRRLDFLASIYTDFPYYKEERKEWKRSMDLQMLWEYNAKDVIATWQIAFEQMKDLEDLYAWSVESGTLVSQS
jgi:uracil-DNA glycosylase family 4